MQEQVEDKTVNLAVSTTKLTGHVMWSAFKAFRNYVKEKMAENVDDKITGRQSLKELIGQNQGVSALEIGDGTFKDFLKCADKVGVDYAITVDKSVKPKRYTVFFKARDADALEEVMKNYAQRTMSREKRPSVIKLLNKMKEKVASIPHKVKQRTKQKEQSR
jgi:hypothetical protein